MAKFEKASRINDLPHRASDKPTDDGSFLQLRLALPIRTTCPVCRTDFERVTGGRGRPLRFCSKACRHLEQRRQQRAWTRKQQQSNGA